MVIEKANENDIMQLTELRLAYLAEDYGGLTAEEKTSIKSVLPEYFQKHLDHDLYVYIAREKEIAACAFLLVTEKPANPAFLTGRTGTVLNVYTRPESRRKGVARRLMHQMIEDAKEMKLDFIELKATEAGYPLYQEMGFQEERGKYHPMKLILGKWKS